MIEPAPKNQSLYTIRDLYRSLNKARGHSIRVQGLVAAKLGPTSVLIEDKWGSIACNLAGADIPAVGTSVEIIGFPAKDGLRIDLLHSIVKRIPIRSGREDSDQNVPVLTTVASIRQLDENQANRTIPTRITGVITYSDPDWRQLFFQDATGGIYVKYSGTGTP